MHRLFYIIAIALIILESCRNDQIEPQSFDFDTAIDAQFERVKINEVIKPVDFVLTSNYLGVLHEAEFGEEQLYVYSLDSLNFLYSFATRGSGPRETVALDLFRSSGINDNVDLFDQSCYKRLSYALTDTEATWLGSSHLDLPNLGPLQETWWVNDSVIVFSTLDRELFTFNVMADSIIDCFQIADLFSNITDETEIRKLCGFHFSLRNGNLIVGLHSANQLLTGRICNNKIEVFPKNGELIRIPENTDKIYYTYISQSDSLIFAQYDGRERSRFVPRRGRFSPDFTQEIGCFDESLKPICKILPDVPTPRFYVDSRNNRLLCWNQKSDFDYIYMFPIPK